MSYMRLKISRKEKIAQDIWLFELTDPLGQSLPPFEAGSNLTVVVPNGSHKNYSLCNDPVDEKRYLIAVKKEERGRGGSRSLVDETSVGDGIEVSEPRCEFALDSRANSFLFIAGGIGITPILSMARLLLREGDRLFKLYYITRDEPNTAFLDELTNSAWRPFVTIHHDGGSSERFFDFWSVLERPKAKVHVYCCGPQPMIDTVRNMTGHWPSNSIHFESFGSTALITKESKPFDVVLKKSGITLHIPANRSILEVLRDAGIHVSSSCESGTCGSCKTRLCSGQADHRDLVLTSEERNSQIMVCVSRSLGDTLELDL